MPDCSRPDRWIGLDGAVNVRDCGGLPAAGTRVASGRLVRADNLQDLSAQDVRTLVDVLRVRDVVDLRTETERRLEGAGPIEGESRVTVHHLSLHRESDESPELDDLERVERLEGDLVLPWQRDVVAERQARSARSSYLNYFHDRPDSLVESLRTIARSEGAVLVHCAAGKDRTGVVIALALHLAGVEREMIVDDYLLTADRIEAIMARLATRVPTVPACGGVPSAATFRAAPRSSRCSTPCSGTTVGSTRGWRARVGPPPIPGASGSGCSIPPGSIGVSTPDKAPHTNVCADRRRDVRRIFVTTHT